MHRPIFLVVLAFSVIQAYGSVQVQMPEADALVVESDDDLTTQVKDLQRNLTELWTYIYELRHAVSQHLNHLRQHQIKLETSVDKMHHGHGCQVCGSHGDEHAAHTEDHHHGDDHSHSHSGEHGSYSGDEHSHAHSGDDHSHAHSGGEHSHAHSGDDHSHARSGDDHSHAHSDDDHSHAHSGEHPSHSGEEHSHAGDSHSHSGEHHHYESHFHSHSHSGDDHAPANHVHTGSSHEEGESHNHKDSHENEDQSQQSQVVEPLIEPVIVPSHRQNSYPTPSRTRPESSSRAPLQLMRENGAHHHSHGNDHHHHHNEPLSRSRNRTVVQPKYSEYNLYTFAVCNVQPNRAIPVESQQEVTGQVSLWQKKTGGPLNVHVLLRGFKIGDHHGAHQALQQEEDNESLPSQSGHRHGFHVHTSGDLSNGCQSTGPHYNPKSVNHGGPNALVRHVGDLGNIECDENGVTNILFSDDIASLRGQYSIIGKSIVVHSGTDDLGLGGDEESLRTGNAGTRIACCVIEKVDKLPIRQYKAIKTASQYQNR